MKVPRSWVIQQALCLSLILAIFATSCKGPEGPPGPAGATGATGVAGNANAQQISYTSRTHSGTTDLFVAFPTSVSADVVEKSLLYVYVKQTVKNSSGQTVAYWFSVPGETATGNEYSFYAAAGTTTTPGLFLRRVVNYLAGAETFDAVRVLVVQAGSSVNGRIAAPSVDFRDYEAVRSFYKLAD